MRGIRLIFFIVVWGHGIAGLYGQGNCNLQLSFYPSPGYNRVYQPGMNGFGMGIGGSYNLGARVDPVIGFEYRVSDWGNLLLTSAGIERTWWENRRLRFGSEASWINGLALYRPKSLYITGFEILNALSLKTGRRFAVELFFGMRWTAMPAYKAYGLITSYLELPVGLRVTSDE